MKILKNKVLVPFVFLILISTFFPACAGTDLMEKHRTDKAFVGEWEKYSLLSIKQYGIPFNYEFKNAEIETRIISEEGSLVITGADNVIGGWANFPEYVGANEVKQASLADCPLKTYYYSGFEWSYINGWEYFPEDGSKVVGDYITFIARKENHIVGFAVIYVHCDGLRGCGEVIVDKEFPQVNGKYQKVSEITVKERINEVIELHKASAD